MSHLIGAVEVRWAGPVSSLASLGLVLASAALVLIEPLVVIRERRHRAALAAPQLPEARVLRLGTR